MSYSFAKLQMSTENPAKRHRRSHSKRKRDEQRLAAFLATKCHVCHTPRETHSRSFPCCGALIHEACFLNCIRQDPHCLHCGGELLKCPKCHAMLYRLNPGDEQPAKIPEGYHVFRFEHVRYEPGGGSSEAATSFQ